jgi:hypothetical protein
MPFKVNAARHHHTLLRVLSRPKQKRKVTNWAAYDASLGQRGSLTVWFTEEAIVAWRAAPRTTRGGQPWYSPLAILMALTLKAVFRPTLRQDRRVDRLDHQSSRAHPGGSRPLHPQPASRNAGCATAALWPRRW